MAKKLVWRQVRKTNQLAQSVFYRTETETELGWNTQHYSTEKQSVVKQHI